LFEFGRAMLGIAVLPLAIVVKILIAPFERPVARTSAEVAGWIEEFLAYSGPGDSWDSFISVPIADPELERVRVRCLHIEEEFPPANPDQYCSEAGMAVLRQLVSSLQASRA
jgi:hypothetical protein